MSLKELNFRQLQVINKRRDRVLKNMAKAREEREKSKALDRGSPNAEDVRKIKRALRQVWAWSHARRLVVKRCDLGGGYARCEKCRKRAPKIHVDHITPVGTFNDGYVRRLFVPSDKLQGLCQKCHKVKTKADNKLIADSKLDADFF